jgi:hypothetical protein
MLSDRHADLYREVRRKTTRLAQWLSALLIRIPLCRGGDGRRAIAVSGQPRAGTPLFHRECCLIVSSEQVNTDPNRTADDVLLGRWLVMGKHNQPKRRIRLVTRRARSLRQTRMTRASTTRTAADTRATVGRDDRRTDRER